MKEKKLSRRHARQALLLLWGGIALVLLGTLLRSDPCYIAGVLVLLAAVLYARKVNQCPYCGGRIRGIAWKKPDQGYCPHCQKWLEYDDTKG